MGEKREREREREREGDSSHNGHETSYVLDDHKVSRPNGKPLLIYSKCAMNNAAAPIGASKQFIVVRIKFIYVILAAQ